jgi:hypothetical protein
MMSFIFLRVFLAHRIAVPTPRARTDFGRACHRSVPFSSNGRSRTQTHFIIDNHEMQGIP